MEGDPIHAESGVVLSGPLVARRMREVLDRLQAGPERYPRSCWWLAEENGRVGEAQEVPT